MKYLLIDIITSICRHLLYLVPVSKKIVFCNFGGRGYGDNPKYIAQEIIKQHLDYELIWLISEGNNYVPKEFVKIRIKSLRAFWILARAKVIVSNTKNWMSSFLFKKKKNQIYIQTWHGDFALKFIEKEVECTLSSWYVKISKRDSIITDAITSGSAQFSKILQDSFWLPDVCEILEYGVPRNDVYFRDEKYRTELKNKYHFGRADKILLYAPTFRDNGDMSCYNLDFEKIRQTLCSMTNEKWKIIIRLHPNIAKQADLFTYNDDIINGSDFPDPQELCFISDCLITDYSSIMSDFMLMKKPVFLYCPDLEKYADKSQGRGLRDIFWKLPFSMGKSQSELQQKICDYDEKTYLDRLSAFMKEDYVSFDNGHASEKVVNYIKNIISQ